MSEHSPKEFYLSKSVDFGHCSDADDDLHTAHNSKVAGDSVTETQYFPLSVPEHNIHGVLYCWYHPNLKVVTGGAWVWQGIKENHISSELADIRSYMNDGALRNGLHSYRFDNSYSVTVLEPMKQLRVHYEDGARNNRIAVEYRAVGDAVMQNEGHHFTQPMQVRGDLWLRGKHYDVNSYAMRDRSWGALRSEEHQHLPPISWTTGIFNDKFYFNCTAFDHPDTGPIWAGKFDLDESRVLNAGYLVSEGKFAKIIQCRKHTRHDPHTTYPDKIVIEFVDEFQRRFNIEGQIVSACSWSAWFNVDVAMCLVKWTCGDAVGYGEIQEARWNDYMVEVWGK